MTIRNIRGTIFPSNIGVKGKVNHSLYNKLTQLQLIAIIIQYFIKLMTKSFFLIAFIYKNSKFYKKFTGSTCFGAYGCCCLFSIQSYKECSLEQFQRNALKNIIFMTKKYFEEKKSNFRKNVDFWNSWYLSPRAVICFYFWGGHR